MTEKIEKLRRAIRYIASVLMHIEYGNASPLLPEGVEYADIFKLSKAHSLAGTLWYFLENNAEIKDSQLKMLWLKEQGIDYAKNLVQTEEFQRLCLAFSECEISFLPMKGFIFKKLWTKPEYRTMSDIDIYVGEDGIKRAGELLLSMGYSLDVEGRVHSGYSKPPYMHIELHRLLSEDNTSGFECWNAKEDNPFWYTMDHIQFTVFNLSHMYKHFVSGGCGARSVFDLLLYMDKHSDEIDKDKLYSSLSDNGLLEFYKQIVSLIQLWFKRDLSDSLLDISKYIIDGNPTQQLLETEYFIITGGAYGSVENRVEYGLKNKSRLGYFLKRVFPDFRVMSTHYKWLKKIPILLPVAYILRLCKGIANGKAAKETRLIANHKSK